MSDDLIAEGQDALERGEWAMAERNFSAALHGAADPRALEGLGLSLWWLNRLAECHDVLQRAFRAYRREERAGEAAQVAIFLARDFADMYGNMAAYSGWMARAERLAEEAGLCSARVWLLLLRGSETSPKTAVQAAEEALLLARDYGDHDLETVARSYAGAAYVSLGSREQGMRLLDESMAAVTGGEVRSFYAMSEVYCKMLAACDAAADFKRAEEWCRVAEELSTNYGMVPLSGVCRTFFGATLTATGRWREAEETLLWALRAFDSGHKASRHLALIRLAELRIRQGRFEEVEELLRGYEEHHDAAAVLVALDLARGDPAGAAARLDPLLANEGIDVRLAASHLLSLVEVHLARADIAAARTAAHKLRSLARSSDHPLAMASAEVAAARVAETNGKGDAVAHLRRGLDIYVRLGMPLEAGRIRLEIARLRAGQDPEVAIAEARAARATFERLGAKADRDGAALFLRKLGAGPEPGARSRGILTRREREVLNLLGLGLPNPEIASRLFISRKTVESHVSNILAKLNVRNRAEAVAHALRAGTNQNPV